MQELKIIYLDEIDSTNREVRRLGDAGAVEGTVVIADCQTGGKGRLGRTWFSPAGTGIWMSLLLRPELPPEKVSGITLMAATSVCRAIRSATGLNTQIKWPNDLVIDGKKVCGILTESAILDGELKFAVLGIGVNVNQTEFPGDLPHAWSLAMTAERELNREGLIECCLNCLKEDYERYVQSGDLRQLRQEYEAHLVNLDQPVRVLSPAGEWTGVAKGINDSGDLIVLNDQGESVAVNSGEVSVRGVYGYI